MSERWFSGIFLGKKPGTDEYIVMRDTGQVVRARAAKEMLKEMQRTVLQKLDEMAWKPP